MLPDLVLLHGEQFTPAKLPVIRGTIQSEVLGLHRTKHHALKMCIYTNHPYRHACDTSCELRSEYQTCVHTNIKPALLHRTWVITLKHAVRLNRLEHTNLSQIRDDPEEVRLGK